MLFEAKILKIIPSAQHQGIVYDQDVLTELKNGQKVSFFDPNCAIKQEMVGSTAKLSVSLLNEGCKKNLKKEYAIIQTIPTHFKVSGKVIRLRATKGKGYLSGIIDAGAALFLFDAPSSRKLKNGDFITFEEDGNRADIIKVEK